MNYVSSIVKLLDAPQQINDDQGFLKIEARAQFPQARRSFNHNDGSSLVFLTFWGNLNSAVLKWYKPNDYLVIEGYLTVKTKPSFDVNSQVLKCIEINVIKVYPFVLNV